MLRLVDMTHREVHRLCEAFLFKEAELLDSNDTSQWLELLSPDLTYRVPVLTCDNAEHLDQPLLSTGAHLDETFSSIRMRVQRLATGHAWAEQPRSRTCRLITNIRVTARTDTEATVRSNFMLYRTQRDGSRYDLLCGERHDRLVIATDGLRLRDRVVLLTPTTLQTPNLGIFL